MTTFKAVTNYSDLIEQEGYLTVLSNVATTIDKDSEPWDEVEKEYLLHEATVIIKAIEAKCGHDFDNYGKCNNCKMWKHQVED